MSRSHCPLHRVLILAGFGLLASMAVAQPEPTPPAVFTYQGRLTSAGAPATGVYDFRFRVCDVPTGSGQIGPTLTLDDLPVTAGLFTARLDIGLGVFLGGARWLEIEVRPGASTGAYTTLTPRQELTAAPYSLGPWETVTQSPPSGGYPPNGYYLRTGPFSTAYVSIDAANGDLHANGGADGAFSIYSEGVTAGSFNIVSGNAVRMRIANATGNVGINTLNPTSKLHVIGGAADVFPFVVELNASGTGNAIRGIVNAGANGNFSSGVTGVNTALAGPSGGFGVYGEHTNGGTGVRGVGSGSGNGVEGIATGVNGLGGYFANTNPGGTALWANGLAMVKSLQILGGSDLAEPFDVAASLDVKAEPGMVVVIDPAHPGELRVSTSAYDTKVAGIISGANGLATGMVMRARGQEHADGEHPVALSGRVWCYVDATGSAIEPGDLLTTSDVPGHAMKAEGVRTGGAVIGKAMTGLREGKGLALVLVSLQ